MSAKAWRRRRNKNSWHGSADIVLSGLEPVSPERLAEIQRMMNKEWIALKRRERAA